jgi:aspartate racemase
MLMKVIGLLGGMTWESTLEYYRIINERVKAVRGGFHSARCLIYSFDFATIQDLQKNRRWDELTTSMVKAAKTVEKAGAGLIIICANTMHITVDKVQKKVSIPFVNIIDVTAEAILNRGIRSVGLLGTRITMEEDFYTKKLHDDFGIDVVIPRQKEREIVHEIIFNELSMGVIKKSSKTRYLKIIDNLLERKADGIILGCTEIPLLIQQEDVQAPVFNTTALHAKAAVDFAFKS